MQNQWMNRSILAISISLAMVGTHVYAADADEISTIDAAQNIDATTEITTLEEQEGTKDPLAAAVRADTEAPLTGDNNPAATESNVVLTTADRPESNVVDATPVTTPETPSLAATPANVLEQKEDDASAKSNLEEVFTRSEQQYSLSKRGSYSAFYDIDYTYYRDSRLDLALSDGGSSLTRLRVEEDAQHTITNTFTFQYGLLDNLTLTASLPLVAKSDNLKDETTAGLGDINFGARWEPFPLKQGRLPLILFGSLSTKTGDSPYEINALTGLSTGKGYYSIGGGASTRKFIDPVVLFASTSVSYGLKETGINQVRGNRILDSFDPGLSGGISFGFAYSFNYDVSLTMSYQQSFSTGSEFAFTTGETSKPADQTSASLGFSLGVRVTPKTIVNGSVGFGLTEDAPDVSLGLSFPLDFLGFGRDAR